MDLLIHDLACACERDAAQAYGNARFMYDTGTPREPQIRLRAGRVLAVEPQALHATAVDAPTSDT